MNGEEQVVQQPQMEVDPLRDAKTVFSRIKKIELNTLESMVIYNFPSGDPMTVSRFSQSDHKILLLFLRHFNCIFCQATICKVASYYKSLIQMNTVPVLVHQESPDCANEFFSSNLFQAYQPLVKNLLRVSDTEGHAFYNKFHLGRVTIFNGKAGLIKGNIAIIKFKRLGLTNSVFTKEKRASNMQMPGVFLIEKGKVQNLYEYKTVVDNPLFINVVVDPAEQGFCSDAFCDLTGNVNKFLPKVESDKKVDSTQNDNNGEEIIVMDEVSKSQPMKIPKLLDPYSTVSNYIVSPNASLFSCQTRIQEEVVPESVKKSISLEDVLENKRTIKYFKAFCASEFSVENLLFYEAVNMYKSNFLVKALDERDVATKIMKTFFEPGSVNELNTSLSLIKNCQSSFKENGPTENLFDEIVKTVLGDQLSDTFIRFKKTKEFDTVAHILISSQKGITGT